MYDESCLPRIGSNIKILRSANVLGCTLETLLDRKAAAEWAQAHDAEADEQASGAKSERVPETAAAETDEQEQYSLEEVRLLLKLLQIQRNICSYR